MKTYHSRIAALAAGFAMAASANAINPPSIAQTLTDGDTYVLMNYAQPTMFCTRTSWDGAYYLMNYTNWKNNTNAWQPIDFTAHKQDDGSWTFTVAEGTEEEPATGYLGIPASMINVLSVDTEVTWTVTEGSHEGYYKLIPNEGCPNAGTVGHALHLSRSGEYLIVYPAYDNIDVFGGLLYDEDGNIVYEDPEADILYPVFANTDQLDWAFVHMADIEDYNARMEVYTAIADIEENYVYEIGFEQGFVSLSEAASALYEAGRIAEAAAIINAKKELYAYILDATEKNEENDSELEAAIAKATDSFNATDDLAALTAAHDALEAALRTYFVSTGNYTYFGQNMGFEDTSSQEGAVGGIGNPPVGWNMYINGEQCFTAADIVSHGVTAWFGVGNDADGDLEGNNCVGVWNPTIPEIELSQTITGLPNGSYCITAAVMAGANGSSRMTTQRIFGNLNSALCLGEERYDKSYLDPTEVYEYADLEEINTDRTLQDMSVNAYVYDGTLTFGFRTNGQWRAINGRTGGNGAGGDGWFKLDNFRIQYTGDDTDTGRDILEYFQNMLNEYTDQDMERAVLHKLEELIELQPATADELNAAILACREYAAIAKASIDGYAKMYLYLEACYDNVDIYGEYAGVSDYEAALVNAMQALDNGELDLDGLAALRTSLEEALLTLQLSGVSVGKDVTDLIANASFENLEREDGNTGAGVPIGWDFYINGNKCVTLADVNAQGGFSWMGCGMGDDISGDGFTDEDGYPIRYQCTDGDNLFGIWHHTIPEIELSQTLTGLPKGTYTLTADVMVQYTWAGDNLTTQRIFANGAVCMFGCPDDYLVNATPDMLAAIERDRAAGFHIEADDFVTEDEEEEEEEDEEMGTRADGDDYLDDSEIDAYRQMNYARYVYGNSPDFDLLHTLTLKFVVAEDGVAHIGFRTNGIDRYGNTGNSNGWFKIDNFTLYYENEEIPTAISKPEITAQPSGIYDLSGRRLTQAPAHGLYIVNGKKVVIR